jgi:hypothetical protein
MKLFIAIALLIMTTVLLQPIQANAGDPPEIKCDYDNKGNYVCNDQYGNKYICFETGQCYRSFDISVLEPPPQKERKKVTETRCKTEPNGEQICRTTEYFE